jgi:hypothetical protein
LSSVPYSNNQLDTHKRSRIVQGTQLARTKVTARVIQKQPHLPNKSNTAMASPSFRASQVSYKSLLLIVYIVVKCMYAFKNSKMHTTHSLEKKQKKWEQLKDMKSLERLLNHPQTPINSHKLTQYQS